MTQASRGVELLLKRAFPHMKRIRHTQMVEPACNGCPLAHFDTKFCGNGEPCRVFPPCCIKCPPNATLLHSVGETQMDLRRTIARNVYSMPMRRHFEHHTIDLVNFISLLIAEA